MKRDNFIENNKNSITEKENKIEMIYDTLKKK